MVPLHLEKVCPCPPVPINGFTNFVKSGVCAFTNVESITNAANNVFFMVVVV